MIYREYEKKQNTYNDVRYIFMKVISEFSRTGLIIHSILMKN